MISSTDINRLLAEINADLNAQPEGDEMATALQREGISDEAMDSLSSNLALLAFKDSIEGGGEIAGQKFAVAGPELLKNMQACFLMAFYTGWQAHKQYGRRVRTEKKV